MSPLARGLVHMEVNRGDGSLGTFLGIQGGLAMNAIDLLGSEAQMKRWLRRWRASRASAGSRWLEPEHGSDSVALESSARRDGDAWVLNGAKRWIGNGSVGDVVVVWARDVDDGQVKGFLVEKGTPASPQRRSPARPSHGRSGKPRSRWMTRACPRRVGCTETMQALIVGPDITGVGAFT
jgi:glutaryl-CoA dehydrogenase